MKNYFLILAINVVVIPFLIVTDIAAYEVSTHEEITENAFNSSVLALEKIEDKGISISKSSIIKKLREGSAREDETIPSDWGGEWARYQNHFFDPTKGNGLDAYATIAGNLYHVTGYPAPDWALGSYSTQFYSIPKAKEYYLIGLTATDKTTRDKNLAKTFRALGQVMHTIQDMAQPQHTRNDSHGGAYVGGLVSFGTESMYEAYINGHVGNLPYNPPYMPSFPTIDSYRKFYKSGDGKGLAEFSNRSFVTEGTNFYCLKENVSNGCDGAISHGGYTFPALNKNLKSEVPIEQLSPGTNLTGLVTFYGNVITDSYSTQTFINNTMTTYSIFDKDLEKKGLAPEFTLNNFNYDSMAGILLPRAVGYSAGLLNYFFRGQMEATGVETSDSSGISGIDVTIKNTTPNEVMSNGTFFISYRYKSPGAIEYTHGLSSGMSSGTLPPDTDVPHYSFNFTQPIPKDAIDKQYILVFQGNLGNEAGAVIGKVVDLGAWEDWELGLFGRHQWIPSYGCSQDCQVVKGNGDNHSNILKVTTSFGFLETRFQNSLAVPMTVSFDYYVASYGMDPRNHIDISLVGSYDYWGGSENCWIGLYNPGSSGFCGTAVCESIEKGSWVHVKTEIPRSCTSWMPGLAGVRIEIWGDNTIDAPYTPAELYLDNINFEW